MGWSSGKEDAMSESVREKYERIRDEAVESIQKTHMKYGDQLVPHMVSVVLCQMVDAFEAYGVDPIEVARAAEDAAKTMRRLLVAQRDAQRRES